MLVLFLTQLQAAERNIVVEEMNSSKIVKINLEKQKGPTMIFIWASWCPFCAKLALIGSIIRLIPDIIIMNRQWTIYNVTQPRFLIELD